MAGFLLEIARAASASLPHELETRLDLPLHRVRRTDIQVYESIHTQQSSDVYEKCMLEMINLIKQFVDRHIRTRFTSVRIIKIIENTKKLFVVKLI